MQRSSFCGHKDSALQENTATWQYDTKQAAKFIKNIPRITCLHVRFAPETQNGKRFPFSDYPFTCFAIKPESAFRFGWKW